MQRSMIVCVLCILICGSQLLYASPRHYHAAKQALIKQDFDQYRKHAKRMGDYLLKPLVESEYLRNRLDIMNADQIETFLEENSDIYPSNSLRTDYLNRLIRQNKTKRFQQIYRPDVNDIALECHYLTNLLRADAIDNQIEKRIQELWLTANSRPDSCNPMFKHWKRSGNMTQDHIWDRIELAIDRNRFRMATYLAKTYLTTKQKAIVDLWVEVRKKPSKKLGSTRFASTELAGKIITDGLEQIARQDPIKAEQIWNKLKSQNAELKMYEPQVYAAIGYRAAINHKPNASTYMQKASFEQEKVRHWAIRTALREQNWSRVLEFFPNLTDQERKSVDWRYWQARALEQTGKAILAQTIYKEISSQRDYYSFLAADRVDLQYKMNNKPITVPTDNLENSRAFKIAKELYEVEDASYMRRQWQWAIRKLDNTGLQAAAKIASKWGFHDRAIITAGRARYFDDVDLRFPLIHKKTVFDQAKRNRLPESYVYGIMRQESAFIENVRSSAGALGLMQIMPATGKLIWKKQKKTNYRSALLLDPETNIGAGSFYLRDMLNRFDEHYALATAAYNAGPSRPRKWQNNRSLDADIWIENIPFKETRGYVKNVLMYKAIYDHKLGNKIRISKFLTKVNAG